MKAIYPVSGLLLAYLVLVGCGNEVASEDQSTSNAVMTETVASDGGQAGSADSAVAEHGTSKAGELGDAIIANKSVSAIRTFSDCSQCPEMALLPAGAFTMGEVEGRGYPQEKPAHEVTIAKPFAIGVYEVTFSEWDACVADGGCDGYQPSDAGWGRGSQPVINVSWYDAKSYTDWLAQKTGKPYRLPSEAEWEYAARAGTSTAFWWGDEIGQGHANCPKCGSQWDEKQTAPVGSFAPNAFGLYDMAGNASEWVEDCGSDNYNNVPVDGSPNSDCSKGFGLLGVTRGGSYGSYSPQRAERSAARTLTSQEAREFVNSLGFRVALSMD
ncbi:formylglycine-generating enzyme family protein [Hyphomonas sp.]|uniref:formylglycine-generating enzyme family protein n=1 Tax=Hyphomonas sp. TaxID=87 RepID=UPI0032427FCC